MVRWCHSRRSPSRWEYGSPRLERYNGLPSMEILGQAAPGKSTGEAMELMEQLASRSAQPVLAMTGRGCPIRNVSPATRHLHCTRFR
ncbi:efflux RND transporter permease subunit [Escherichia coli]